MPMMAKMRSLGTAFIIIVGVLFVAFMVVSDSNVLEFLGGRSANVGSVNGEDISYQEYNAFFEKMREQQKQQTGQDIDEENMQSFKEQVWDAFVSQKIFQQEIDKLGITVSDQEVVDLVYGPNPPEFLKRNFIDSLGNFNRQAYTSALQDPRNKTILLQVEDAIRQELLQKKYQSYISASVTVGEDELRRTFIDNTNQLNFAFALFDANLVKDNEVSITDTDLKNWYDKNQSKFKVKESRKIKFVMFNNQASVEDSNIVRNDLQDVLQLAKDSSGSFQNLVETHSSMPYSKDTLTFGQLADGAKDAIAKASANSIVGPIPTDEGLAIYKIYNVLPSEDVQVSAAHILVNASPDSAKNYEEAMNVYNRLVNGKEDFAKLAQEVSSDKGSAVQGGNLGWFGKGMMVKEFENAAFNNPVGTITKPIKTQFGYHIIKVTGKSDKKYVVEKIVNPIKPSATTRESAFQTAKDFAYLADEKGGFEQEAKNLNYKINESATFYKDSYSIPGLGINKRLIDWAFENDVNDLAEEPFTAQTGYIVAKVSEVIKEGVQPFDKVKDQIKALAMREKKIEKAGEIAKNVMQKANGNLFAVPSIDSRVKVDTTGTFTFATKSIPKIGRDFALVHHARELKVNQTSQPIKGLRGYYVINVKQNSGFDQNAYKAERSNLYMTTLQDKRNVFFNQFMAQLKKNADIEDNRHQFYGQ